METIYWLWIDIGILVILGILMFIDHYLSKRHEKLLKKYLALQDKYIKALEQYKSQTAYTRRRTALRG